MAMPIGKKIEAEIRKRGFKITTFAKLINCTRSNLYNIFERNSVNTEQLKKIASVLNLDPFYFYSGLKEYKTEHALKISEETQAHYEAGDHVEALKKLVALLEEKLQEKDDIIRKLEEKIKRLSKSKK